MRYDDQTKKRSANSPFLEKHEEHDTEPNVTITSALIIYSYLMLALLNAEWLVWRMKTLQNSAFMIKKWQEGVWWDKYLHKSSNEMHNWRGRKSQQDGGSKKFAKNNKREKIVKTIACTSRNWFLYKKKKKEKEYLFLLYLPLIIYLIFPLWNYIPFYYKLFVLIKNSSTVLVVLRFWPPHILIFITSILKIHT